MQFPKRRCTELSITVNEISGIRGNAIDLTRIVIPIGIQIIGTAKIITILFVYQK